MYDCQQKRKPEMHMGGGVTKSSRYGTLTIHVMWWQKSRGMQKWQKRIWKWMLDHFTNESWRHPCVSIVKGSEYYYQNMWGCLENRNMETYNQKVEISGAYNRKEFLTLTGFTENKKLEKWWLQNRGKEWW